MYTNLAAAITTAAVTASPNSAAAILLRAAAIVAAPTQVLNTTNVNAICMILSNVQSALLQMPYA